MPYIPMHTETEPNKPSNFQGSLFKLSNNLNREGKISRISMIPNLFYVKENASQRVFGIELGHLQGFRGETLKQFGIKVGAPVRFRTKDDQRTVEAAEVLR